MRSSLIVFAFLLVLPVAAGAKMVVAAPGPTACPSASPSAVPTAVGTSAAGVVAASPSPCDGELKTIAKGVAAYGRTTDLVGKAISASTGTINQEQIATRPLLRPGEVLEDVPGLVISQHSGCGKANQYYLRGFQLDHGTNLEADLNGIPVNLGSHAHGQGYSDINYLIPELVSYVEFKKGTYFADQGDFAVAGGYSLFYRNTIAPTSSFTVGDFGYDRLFTADTASVGNGKLLYGVEIAHDNGSYKLADEYHRLNGVLRYSLSAGRNDFAATAIGYNGSFNSTDQIPQRLVDDGTLSRFGYVDPTDGGNTYRYALSTQFTRDDGNGRTKVNAYGVNSFLNLFSNFTYNYFDANDYYNVTQNPITCNPAYNSCTPNPGTADLPRSNKYQSFCPANNTAAPNAAYHSTPLAPYSFTCGDQRQQTDKRTYYGVDFSRSFVTPGTETTLGAGFRNDNAPTVGLFLTADRNAFPNGTLSNDHVTNTSEYAYLQSRLTFGKLKVTPGIRLDHYTFTVAAYDPANSGSANQALLDPKMALAYAVNPRSEFYADYGESFHSNDARGAIGNDDPQTHAPFDSTGTPVLFNAPLTRAAGYEVGYRYTTKQYTSTISAFRLLVANELDFDGDHGTTELGAPNVRQGIEFANFYSPSRYFTLDSDFATTTARSTSDPTNSGTGVAESLAAVVSAGATFDTPKYAASLRMRYFGPRQLDSAGDFSSPPSMEFNMQLTAKFSHRTALSLDVFNILNASSPDVTYYYNSWLKSDAANPTLANDPSINPALGGGGVNDYHFHPSQARTARLTLTTGL